MTFWAICHPGIAAMMNSFCSGIGSISSSSLVIARHRLSSVVIIIVKIIVKLVWMLARPSLVDVGKDKLPDYKKKGGERDGAQPLFPSFFYLFSTIFDYCYFYLYSLFPTM